MDGFREEMEVCNIWYMKLEGHAFKVSEKTWGV